MVKQALKKEMQKILLKYNKKQLSCTSH